MTHRDEGPAGADGRITRRRALRIVGVGGTVGLAGCLNDDEPCDLSVSKAHSGDPISYGDTTDFEITVCNEGDETCESAVTVIDDLPIGTTFAGNSGSGWTCTASGGSVTCEHPNSGGLAGGDCLPPLTLTVDVGSQDEVGPEIANCATVEQGDPDLGHKQDCVKVPIEPSEGDCDLGITKHYDGDVIVAGTTATFEIEVCNEGDGPCTDSVTVVDGLPSGVSFDSGTGTGWSCTESGGVVSCSHDNSGGLAPGECLPILELTVDVGSMDETGDQIRNCASIEGSDADTSNNRDCVSVPVQPPKGTCDLSIQKTHSDGGVVMAGDTTTFDILVCNEGDGFCSDPVTVTDDLPNGVSFASGSGSGWTVNESGGVVTATHSNTSGLADGDCLPVLTLEMTVGSIDETGDQFRNCARLDVDDENTANNTDCATVTVTQPIQGCNGLDIEKVAATQFTYGQQESYEITVCNPTDQQCDSQITVTDDLPDGISFVSASGNGWSASASGGVVTATHSNTGGLAPGGCLPTLTLTVDVVPAAQFPGGSDAVQNCAELIADGAVVDESCVTHVIWNI